MIDQAMDFAKAVGLPGVILLAGLYVVYELGGRYVDYVIEAERLERKHRIETQRAQVEISKDQQQMLTQTLTQFLKAHIDQASAVQDIADALRQEHRSTP